MTMVRTGSSFPRWAAICAIAAMALLLTLGLALTGISGNLDSLLLRLFLPDGLDRPTGDIGPILLWVIAAGVAFILPTLLLYLQVSWQRVSIFVATLVLTILWVPVLILAAMKPEMSIIIATVTWSGCCAIFYAGSQLDVSEHPERISKPATPAGGANLSTTNDENLGAR